MQLKQTKAWAFAGFRSWRVPLACLALHCGAGGAVAGELRIVDGADKSQISIDADDVKIGEILTALAARYSFATEGLPPGSLARKVTFRFQGPLDRALERLLRHEGVRREPVREVSRT